MSAYSNGIELSKNGVYFVIEGGAIRGLYINNKNSVYFNAYQGLDLYDGTSNKIYSVEGSRGTYTGDGTQYRSIYTDDKFNINDGIAIITAKSENLCGIVYRECALIFHGADMYADVSRVTMYGQSIYLIRAVPFNLEGVEYEYFIV